MKNYWDLTFRERAEVNADPTVLAADVAAKVAAAAARAAHKALAAAIDAHDAASDAFTKTQYKAIARLFKKGKLK